MAGCEDWCAHPGPMLREYGRDRVREAFIEFMPSALYQYMDAMLDEIFGTDRFCLPVITTTFESWVSEIRKAFVKEAPRWVRYHLRVTSNEDVWTPGQAGDSHTVTTLEDAPSTAVDLEGGEFLSNRSTTDQTYHVPGASVFDHLINVADNLPDITGEMLEIIDRNFYPQVFAL